MNIPFLVHYKLLVYWKNVIIFQFSRNKICLIPFSNGICLNSIIFNE